MTKFNSDNQNLKKSYYSNIVTSILYIIMLILSVFVPSIFKKPLLFLCIGEIGILLSILFLCKFYKNVKSKTCLTMLSFQFVNFIFNNYLFYKILNSLVPIKTVTIFLGIICILCLVIILGYKNFKIHSK